MLHVRLSFSGRWQNSADEDNLLNHSSINAAGFARVYNLPIYFQAIDVSPSESGIRVLPTILAICKCPYRRCRILQA